MDTLKAGKESGTKVERRWKIIGPRVYVATHWCFNLAHMLLTDNVDI